MYSPYPTGRRWLRKMQHPTCRRRERQWRSVKRQSTKANIIEKNKGRKIVGAMTSIIVDSQQKMVIVEGKTTGWSKKRPDDDNPKESNKNYINRTNSDFNTSPKNWDDWICELWGFAWEERWQRDEKFAPEANDDDDDYDPLCSIPSLIKKK